MRLDIDGVTVEAAGARLVDDIRLTADSGAFVGLVGPNGSGKSTLLRCVYRALRPAVGVVRLDGEDAHAMPPRAAARVLAALPQESSAEFDFTVAEVVAMGRLPHRERTAASDTEICARAMRRTGVDHLADRGSWPCPAARSSASCSPARSPSSPGCSSSTNPPTTSTSPTSWTCCPWCATAASPCSPPCMT